MDAPHRPTAHFGDLETAVADVCRIDAERLNDWQPADDPIASAAQGVGIAAAALHWSLSWDRLAAIFGRAPGVVAAIARDADVSLVDEVRWKLLWAEGRF